MLYEMNEDPHQTDNLFHDRPELTAQFDQIVQNYLQENLGYHGSLPDPMQEVISTGPFKYVTLEGWIDWLHKRGRHGAATEILRRLDLDEGTRTRDGRMPI